MLISMHRTFGLARQNGDKTGTKRGRNGDDNKKKENPRYFYRLRVQAGLTGYAQVYGKKTSVQEDLLKLDLIYIQHFSALMDMKLMLLSLQGESRQ